MLLTPTEWTIHFGTPVVPDEYIINKGWLNGTCSKVNSGSASLTTPVFKKSSNRILKLIKWYMVNFTPRLIVKVYVYD